MSRIGKQIITIPDQVEVTKGEAGLLTVAGPHGTLKRVFRPEIEIVIDNGTISFVPQNSSAKTRALWGTCASHVSNMVQGVSEQFVKRLIVEGVGYKVEIQGKNLVLLVGFSHPVSMEIPEGLQVETEKNTITITGADKEMVGLFAGKVRSVKKPEPYKGKGIRYEDEVVRRKEGKKSA